LTNFLVQELLAAVKASRAMKIFICNLATEPGETDAYTCGDHLRAVEAHTGERIFDVAIVNRAYDGKLPAGVEWVKVDERLEDEFPIYQADLVDNLHPWRHDSEKLARVIMDLFEEKTGPLVQ
jgi:uncharacterized cofD-like protein